MKTGVNKNTRWPFDLAAILRGQRYPPGYIQRIQAVNSGGGDYLHDQERNELQRFIGESQWAYEPMLDELTCQVGRELGEADGVIVFDPSGFEKDGKKPVGVQRLDCAAVA